MRRYSDTARLIPKKLSNYGKNYLRWGEWLIIAPTLRPDFPSYAAIAQHEHSCLFWGGSFCELGILVLSVKFSALWRVIIKSHTLLTRDIASLGRNINKLNQRKPAFAVLSTVMENRALNLIFRNMSSTFFVTLFWASDHFESTRWQTMIKPSAVTYSLYVDANWFLYIWKAKHIF